MRDLIWRLVERRLTRVIPRHAASTIGDLAEDYARQRRTRGALGARVWLVRESTSLANAYRVAEALDPVKSRWLVGSDLRHALRRLAARPARAALCAGLLALGIGLCTAMFGVIDALLWRPAPFPLAERLVRQGVWTADEPALLRAWRESRLFDRAEAGRVAKFVVDSDGGPVTWAGAFVTPGTFSACVLSAAVRSRSSTARLRRRTRF